MISDEVHKVHIFRNFQRTPNRITKYNIVHQMHRSIKRHCLGAHRFTIFITFYSNSSRRDFVKKCTHVHLPDLKCSDRSDSDAPEVMA
jgi:hypothetical protein